MRIEDGRLPGHLCPQLRLKAAMHDGFGPTDRLAEPQWRRELALAHELLKRAVGYAAEECEDGVFAMQNGE